MSKKANWKVINVKERELRGGKNNGYLSSGKYLFTSSQPSDYESQTYCPIRANTGKQFLGWLLPITDWVARYILGAKPNEIQEFKDVEFWQMDPVLTSLKEIYEKRPFQKKILNKIKDSLLSLGVCKKTIIAPLGSGKTIMGMSAAAMVGSDLPYIVVAPPYLHDNWRNEAKKWGFREPILTSYESCHKYHTMDNVKSVIFDETLRTKNPEAGRSVNAQILAKNKILAIAMTGTPTSSKEALDWRHILTVNPGAVPDNEQTWYFLFGTNARFEEIYGRREIKYDGWAHIEIANLIKPYVEQISLEEIAASLPPVTFHKIMLDTPDGYHDAKDGFFTVTDSVGKKIAQARQATSGFYYDDEGQPVDINEDKINWIKVFLEDNPDESVIIFSAFIHSQKKILKALEEYKPAVNFGDTVSPGTEIQRFLNKETKVFICSSYLTEGFNIHTVCATAIFESNGMSPVMRQQAIGRLKRPDAPKPVNIYDLQCKRTLDEKLLELLETHIDFSEAQITELLKKGLYE